MIVEDKLQLSTHSKDDGKVKEIVPSPNPKAKGKQKENSIDEADLKEDIVILNWDLSIMKIKQMDILGELWKKRARQQKLKDEKRNNQVLKDIKGIFLDALSIEVNEKDSILDQLVHIIHKFNEDTNGQEKLIQKTKRKFEHRILENVVRKIAIDQVE